MSRYFIVNSVADEATLDTWLVKSNKPPSEDYIRKRFNIDEYYMVYILERHPVNVDLEKEKEEG